MASADDGHQIRLWNVASRQCRIVLLPLKDQRAAAISTDGHYRGTPGADERLLYLVLNSAGHELFTPEQFSRRYRWKNDPERVRLDSTPPDRRASARANSN
jgi:hypothetical protein